MESWLRHCLSFCVALSVLMSAASASELLPAHETAAPLFRNHVQSVLTKAGCNQGACHGAAAGKNGFILSLRGYNDEADWTAITRGAIGRRLVPSDPGRSLLLTKPTGAVPHKGGRRFEVDSPEYRVIARWIANGAPGPLESDPRLERLEILPPQAVLNPGAIQQFTVRGHFSDGRVEDVTRWVKYTSANEGVANVGDTGIAKVVGYGEGAVSAWYLSRLVSATVTSPYPNELAADALASAPKRNFIDKHVNEKLLRLHLPASPRSRDGEFLRRAFLDTIGVLPTPAETREFLMAPEGVAKRDALIEKLLARPEFIDYWTYKWSDLLLVNSSKLPTRAARTYYAWLRRAVEANQPWDALVRDLVTAQGSSLENGAVNFFVLHDDPRLMAETATQAFLGMSVGCAKCHNHPMEKWTNDDYYALANLFSRVRTKSGASDGERVVASAPVGELIQPRTGKPQRPRPLDGKPLALDDSEDRREHFARWLTSPKNPYFAKAIVNRVWANFLGVGLVQRVDDLRVSNPASNEGLFTAAADYLIAERFDLKALMRAILQSETYQRTGETRPGNEADTRFYSRYYPRRLMAEVILDALSQVTGAPTEFVSESPPGRKPEFSYPAGYRALQLPDSFVQSYFLKNFGRPDRLQTCECERTTEPSVAQVLHLANGDTLNRKLAAAGNRLSRMLDEHWSPEKMVDELCFAAFARPPRDAERERLGRVLAEAGPKERRAVLEDTFWAVLSSKEFLFTH
ncbi:MAG: DUF1553 domain-containing protein [Pedosphaera sp.]|nr:DUF1553 domain-containing protein [Pedosphaera sp.]